MTIALEFMVGIGLVAITARLLVHAAVLPRIRLSQHLRQIEGYGFREATADADQAVQRKLDDALARVSERLGRFLAMSVPSLTPLTAAELSAAGHRTRSAMEIHGYRALAAVVLPMLALGLVAAGGGLSLIGVALVASMAAGGWILPAVIIRHRGSARLDKIDSDLPDLIDVLIATVEAGMGVAGSLSLVANRFRGPLGEELKLTLQQQKLGISSQQALSEMAERCNTPSVRAFVRTVMRSESMGGSIGPILRELAADQRQRRRQAAREKMQKAPVKMLFPLILLIFPALMIELLYPAVYSLVHNLGHGL